MIHVLVVAALTAEIRDNALRRAEKLPGIDVLFVGENKGADGKKYVFVCIDQDTKRPAVDILGHGQYPDTADFESIVAITASAKVEMKIVL